MGKIFNASTHEEVIYTGWETDDLIREGLYYVAEHPKATVSDNQRGLYQKYSIKKLVKENGLIKESPVSKDAEYFVLRLDEGGKDRNHIAACRIGIHAYADAIESFIPELANDLRERYPLLNTGLAINKNT